MRSPASSEIDAMFLNIEDMITAIENEDLPVLVHHLVDITEMVFTLGKHAGLVDHETRTVYKDVLARAEALVKTGR